MKTIIHFLKTKTGARLTYYKRWMLWDKEDKKWIVFEEGEGELGKELIKTSNLDMALEHLYY